jgi:sulfide:quinone oxidoreductase
MNPQNFGTVIFCIALPEEHPSRSTDPSLVKGKAHDSLLSNIACMYEFPPSLPQKHYYQPMWTFVGAGAKTLAESCQPMSSLMPPQANWVKASVSEFHPDKNYITTSDGTKIGYEYLVVALGLQVNFDKVGVGKQVP